MANSNLKIGDQTLASSEVSKLLGHPFIDGMERKDVLASGYLERFGKPRPMYWLKHRKDSLLAADCTVPGKTLKEPDDGH